VEVIFDFRVAHILLIPIGVIQTAKYTLRHRVLNLTLSLHIYHHWLDLQPHSRAIGRRVVQAEIVREFPPENEIVKPIERCLKGFSRSVEAGHVVDALRCVRLWESARNAVIMNVNSGAGKLVFGLRPLYF
jgi:hypothetical protein